MIKFVLPLIFLNLLLTSCAPENSLTPDFQPKKSSNPKSQVEQQKNIKSESYNWHGDIKANPVQQPADSNSDFIKMVANSMVNCSGNCPSGVGLLLVYHADKNQISRCTTFLIEPDVIGTNSHCVPNDLKYSGANTSNRLFVVFPYSNEIAVSHVIYASDIDNKDFFVPDFAFLKLSAEARGSEILNISRKGFKDGTNVEIWHVSQGPEIYSGINLFTVSSLSCGVSQNLGLFPMFSSDSSPISTLTNCKVAEGESGSPIVGHDGQVIGLLNAYFKIENTPIGQLIAPHEILSISRIAMAANFSCIRDFSITPEKLSDACNVDMSKKSYIEKIKRSYKAALLAADRDLETQVQEMIERWLAENSKIFRWKIVQENDSEAGNAFNKEIYASPPVRPEIECIQPVDQWKDDFKTMMFFYKTSATVSAKTFIWGINVGVNNEFKYFPKASSSESRTLEIEFNPAETITTGVAEVKITSKFKILGEEITLPPMNRKFSVCR